MPQVTAMPSISAAAVAAAAAAAWQGGGGGESAAAAAAACRSTSHDGGVACRHFTLARQTASCRALAAGSAGRTRVPAPAHTYQQNRIKIPPQQQQQQGYQQQGYQQQGQEDTDEE
jgi:hypothetical protein